jgi:hypothetical protein
MIPNLFLSADEPNLFLSLMPQISTMMMTNPITMSLVLPNYMTHHYISSGGVGLQHDSLEGLLSTSSDRRPPHTLIYFEYDV